MRVLVIFLCVLIVACSSAVKQPARVLMVHDNEHILTEAQINELHELYFAHEQKTTNEILLLTTPDIGEDTLMSEFAVRYGNRVGVGKSSTDNGVLIVFSKALREAYIATGKGTEHILTDEIAQTLVNSVMVPHFREEKYYEGLLAGSKAIIAFLELPGNEIR